MKAAFAREYKKFGIKAARKPQEGYPVAGVVQVVGKDGGGFVYVKFSEVFVEAVGKAMPYGVSAATPCYLKAVWLPTGKWRVVCYYFGRRNGCVLWEASHLEWVKKVKRGERNGACTEAAKIEN